MISLIYALGRRDIYDPYIASDLSATKADGSSIWRTLEEAESFIAKSNLVDFSGFSIYAVAANWERDARTVGTDDKYRELTRNAYLVNL